MKSVWSKMPSRWIRDRALRAFRAHGPTGSAAALKLYMALAMHASFKPSPTADAAGAVRLSFTQLETLCDMSRRYVSLGLTLLETRELLTIQNVGNAHRYVLTGYEEPGWAKLPRAHLLEPPRFKAFGIRGALYLNALKLYLALITFRDNNTHQVLLSYDKIEEYTGIPRPHIRRSIDVLLNHDWMSIGAHAADDGDQRPINVYLLRGDFWGRKRSNYARVALGTVVS